MYFFERKSVMDNILIFYFLAQAIERVLELIDWIVSIIWNIPEKAEKEDANKKRFKMVGMWILATLFGFAFCYSLKLQLMLRLNMEVHIWADYFFTSLILGSGTKPVHDIISLMGRAKK